MKRLKTLSLGLTTFILATSCTIAAPKVEHYVFHYESGDVYEVKIDDSSITWKGLAGPDKGNGETDYINRKKLSDDVEVMQWKETNGAGVTLVLDRTHLKTVSSGKIGNDSWLWYGDVEVK